MQQQLLAASAGTAVIDLGEDALWVVDGAAVSEVVANAPAGTRSLTIRNASIKGGLALFGMELAFALRFEGCFIGGVLDLRDAQLVSVAIIDCRLKEGVLANGIRTRRDVDLSGSTITGALESEASTSQTSTVWLSEAEIGGRLLCDGTRIHSSAARAIQADRTTFGGSVRFIHGFFANAELRFIGAHFRASVDFTGSVFRPSNKRALDLGESTIDGSVFIIADTEDYGEARTSIHGRVELGNARVGGRVLIRSVDWTGSPAGKGGHFYLDDGGQQHVALWAPRLAVAGDFLMQGDCTVSGLIDLRSAEIGGSFSAEDHFFRAENAPNVDLSLATVGGDVSLANSDLTRVVHPGAENYSRERFTFVASGLDCKGVVNLSRAKLRGGGIQLRNAVIGANVELHGVRIDNAGGYSLALRDTVGAGSVRLVGGSFVGRVSANHATFQGRLVVEDAQLKWSSEGSSIREGTTTFNPLGSALELIASEFKGGLVLNWRSVDGVVDLTDCRTSYLADDHERWPAEIRMSGFTYDRFAPVAGGGDGEWSVQQRTKWLGRQATADPGTYEQAAKVFRSRGAVRSADELLIEGRRLRRHLAKTDPDSGGVKRRLLSAVDRTYEEIAGYGLKPWRALAPIGILVLVTIGWLLLAPAGTVVTSVQSEVIDSSGLALVDVSTTGSAEWALIGHDRCEAGEVECFSIPWFAVDAVVPLVDLGQTDTWHASGVGSGAKIFGHFLRGAQIAGWATSAIAALSIAQIGNRSRSN